jgi:hypothetical protein
MSVASVLWYSLLDSYFDALPITYICSRENKRTFNMNVSAMNKRLRQLFQVIVDSDQRIPMCSFLTCFKYDPFTPLSFIHKNKREGVW